MGRPSSYSQELADRICEAISSQTLGLRHICEQNEDFPSTTTIYRWLVENESFREQYARAKDTQLEMMAEEMLDIADDGSNDLMTIVKGDVAYEQENKEVTNRSRLRVDTRKWLLSKLNPKKYGDKLDVTSGDKPLQPTTTQVVIVRPDDEDE